MNKNYQKPEISIYNVKTTAIMAGSGQASETYMGFSTTTNNQGDSRESESSSYWDDDEEEQQ